MTSSFGASPLGPLAGRTPYQDLFGMLVGLEEELDLFNLRIGGVRFWEHIRTTVLDQAVAMGGLWSTLRPPRPSSHRARLNTFANTIRGLALRNPFRPVRSDLVFWGHPRRKPNGTGLWTDLYCDPVIAHLANRGRNAVLFETAHFGTHFAPAQTPDVRYLEPILFLSGITRRLHGRPFVFSNRDAAVLRSIEQRLAAEFAVDIALQPKVSTLISRHVSLLPWLKRLLKAIEPKLVLLTVSYGKETLIQACKETGIPTAELQHGLVGPLHPGYAFPGRGKKEMFPDYFLAFGEFWRNVTPFPIPRKRVISVGYPYFEEQKRLFAGVPPKNRIVFLSQAPIGNYLSRLATAAANDGRIDARVVYKLHPTEYAVWERSYPWLRGSGVQVIDHDRHSLYQLLAESRLLIGCYSTALVEGLGLGIPACVVDLPGYEHLRELLGRGVVRIVRSVDDLALELAMEPGSEDVYDEIFAPHALGNISEWIERQLMHDERL